MKTSHATVSMPATAAAAHPRAGHVMTGAEIIVQVLADEGVDTIFGYSGGAILPTYDAIFRYNDDQLHAPHAGLPMPLIVPANEQGAAFMAAGYARASGKVGVCVVTSGPGATNTVTPVRDCAADSVPIVVICGQVGTAAMGSDAFQEAPVANIMGAVAKHCFLVTDPAKLEATVRTAFDIARSGRPGPVVIDVPKDVQNWQGVFKGNGQLPIRGYQQRMQALNDCKLSDEQAAPAAGNARRVRTAVDLCRRWRDPRRGGGRTWRVREGFRHPGRDDVDGYRRVRYLASPRVAHARHARRGFTPITPSTIATC